MIDTIKIYTEISKEISEEIQRKSIVKAAIDFSVNKLLYKITNDSLKGSYDSSLSVRTDCGSKYGFCSLDGGYYLEIERFLSQIHQWL